MYKKNTYTAKVRQRKDATKKDGTAALYLQVTINRKVLKIGLGFSVSPAVFDEINERVTIPRDKLLAEKANGIIHRFVSKAREIFADAISLQETLTADLFLRRFADTTDKRDFLSFFKQTMSASDHLSDETLAGHSVVFSTLASFAAKISFGELTHKFVFSFDVFLQKKGINPNTRNKYHRTIRRYIHAAQAEGYRVESPYGKNGFKMPSAKTERTSLSLDEVARLKELFASGDLRGTLQEVLRLFLFMIYTGIRISDALTLNHDDIIDDLIVFRPQKTRNTRLVIKIPLGDAVIFISTKRGVLFPVRLTAQTINRYLKEIALAAGIKQNVTSHVARHTFASLYLEAGGDLLSLKDTLGHADLKTTMAYLHSSSGAKRKSRQKFDEHLR